MTLTVELERITSGTNNDVTRRGVALTYCLIDGQIYAGDNQRHDVIEASDLQVIYDRAVRYHPDDRLLIDVAARRLADNRQEDRRNSLIKNLFGAAAALHERPELLATTDPPNGQEKVPAGADNTDGDGFEGACESRLPFQNTTPEAKPTMADVNRPTLESIELRNARRWLEVWESERDQHRENIIQFQEAAQAALNAGDKSRADRYVANRQRSEVAARNAQKIVDDCVRNLTKLERAAVPS